MKRDTKVLSTKPDRHHVRLAKLEERGKPGGRVLGETSKLARPSVNLVIQELLPNRGGSIKIGVVMVEDCPT